jgi:opacity protein-like surface antigen
MKFLTAILALLAGVASAQAADVYPSTKDTPAHLMPALPAQTESSWTGIWAAALAAYNMSNTELSLDLFARSEGETQHANLAKVDGFGGEGGSADFQIGGDVQVGRLVIGAFGEYSVGGIESSASVFNNAARLDVEQQSSACLLGRIGIPSGNTLFYGASGYCWYEFEATLRLGDETRRQDLELNGIPLELGAEHKFTPNIRGRLAGRYTFLDEETVARFSDERFGGKLDADPGVFKIQAGVVISTSGIGSLFGN